VFFAVSLLEYYVPAALFQKKPQQKSVFIRFASRYAEQREGTNSLLKPLALTTVSFTIRH